MHGEVKIQLHALALTLQWGDEVSGHLISPLYYLWNQLDLEGHRANLDAFRK
jgi:hypothetical protein